jgi:phosphoribosylaminoimidazole-succinocarboxamide synthase
VDEVLTPDSSRFWPLDDYEPGRNQKSYDKQFVRDYLLGTDWDRNSSPPSLPDDIIQKTSGRYIEAYETLVGKSFSK